MSTAIYLRVSTKQQDVGAQRLRIRQWLDGHGVTPYAQYVDKITGRTMVRPEFAKLQTDIFDGRVKHVVMYSLDRFARNMVDGLVEIDRWQRAGIKITFVADHLELEFGTWMGDVMAKLMVTMKLAFAEAERERSRQRQQAGIEAAKASGKRWGGSKPGTGLKADPQRALTLRRRGLSNREVAAALDVSTRTAVRLIQRAKLNGTADRARPNYD